MKFTSGRNSKSTVSQAKSLLEKKPLKSFAAGGHFLLEDNLERKNEDEGIGMAEIRKVDFLTLAEVGKVIV